MKKVLIVDDDNFTRKHIRKILEDAGHHVVAEFSDGNQVSHSIQAFQPDIVLMDLVMKTTHGFQAMKDAKKHSPGTKIIMVSSVDNQEVIDGCLKEGASGYITKPFTDEQLLEAIEKTD